MFEFLKKLNKNNKKFIVFLNDIFHLAVAHQIFLAPSLASSSSLLISFISLTIIYATLMELLGGFSEVIRSYSAERILTHLIPLTIYTVSYSLVFVYESLNDSFQFFKSLPFRYVIFNIIAGYTVSFTLITFSRLMAKVLLYGSNSVSGATKVYIFGIGPSARDLFSIYSENDNYEILGFITNDSENFGRSLFGKEIISFKKALKIFKRNNDFNVFLALEQDETKSRSEIINALSDIAVTVKSIPSYSEYLEKDSLVLEELSASDILGREERKHNKNELSNFFKEKNILITGAGGSIGAELCKNLAPLAKNLVFFDSSEYNLYKLKEFFDSYKNPVNVNFEIGDIRDKERLKQIFDKYSPDVVFHAAAYKHVPLLEESENFVEAIKTNIIGSMCVAEISQAYNCDRFIFVSTDKAVRPTNLMGATKRISERIISTLATNSNTIFSSVRFGNVLKSSGSVIPKFKDQIEKGGPVTVTHPDMTRYFMTINEAALLVINAGMMAKTYDTFLLKMGEPVRIYDLAKKMINLYGLDVVEKGSDKEGIEIIFTGLRSGEKKYEELLVSGNEKSTDNDQIFRDECSSKLSQKDFSFIIKELDEIVSSMDLEAFKTLSAKFAEYGEEDTN
mgnify:CR=1 FL=1